MARPTCPADMVNVKCPTWMLILEGRTICALQWAGLTDRQEVKELLASKGDEYFMRLDNFGSRCLDDLKSALETLDEIEG